MAIFFIGLGGIVAVVWMARYFLRRKKSSQGPAFVCDHCDEHHCDCRVKEDN
jgi:hypothetical protein